MVPAAFHTVRVRNCRDLLHVRRQARRIAQSLSFTPRDVICTAAGAFVVAHQARKLLRRADICFALADRQLRIFAKPIRADMSSPRELYTLVKQLPAGELQLAADDLTWLLGQLQLLSADGLEEEILVQNREVLQLLSWLQGGAAECSAGLNPSAA